MIKVTEPRGRPRTKYISQIIKDAGVIFYKKLKEWQMTEKNGEGYCCEYI